MPTKHTILAAILVAGVVSACGPDDPIASATPPRRNLANVGGVASAHLFDGVQLSTVEKQRMFAINRRYNERIAAIQAQSPNPTGPIDAKTLASLRTLRSAQLGEWRGAMSTENVIRFDHNRQLVDAELAQLRTLHPIGQ